MILGNLSGARAAVLIGAGSGVIPRNGDDVNLDSKLDVRDANHPFCNINLRDFSLRFSSD